MDFERQLQGKGGQQASLAGDQQRQMPYSAVSVFIQVEVPQGAGFAGQIRKGRHHIASHGRAPGNRHRWPEALAKVCRVPLQVKTAGSGS